jgi:CDGSH-type Zn-finger protein
LLSDQEVLLTKITIRNNGPIRVEGAEGEFVICDAEGNVFDLAGRTGISLCRCGHSNDKPFCDGQHKQCAFDSHLKARALPPPAVPVAMPSVTATTEAFKA